MNAFENGTLDLELLAGRLDELRSRTAQLATRRDQLTATSANEPIAPGPTAEWRPPTALRKSSSPGTRTQAKASIEAQVAVTGPDRLAPTFRIPQPGNDIGAGTACAVPAPMESVRA